ncbi:Myblike DNAbinding domain-containing protein, partial [Coemansia erecta]
MLSVPRESLLAIHSTNHWARTLLAQKPKSIIVLLRDLHGSTAEAPLQKDSKANKRIRTDFKEDYIYDQTGRKLPAKFIKIRMWRREEKQKLSKAVHRNVYINGYVDWEQVARELDTGRSASLCRTQYQKMIIKEKGAEAAPLLFAKRIQTMVRSKYKLTEGTHQMDTLPLYKRTLWSPKDDDALLDYVAYLGPKWVMVSRHMEAFSPSQCRMRYLRLTEQRKTKEDNTEGPEEPPADAKPPPPRRDWTSENDQRLFELIESGSGTKLQELLPHFPGFGRAQVYMALCRLRAGSKCKTGRWSADEHQRLLELVKQHGTEDWTLISEGMPAPKRLAIQCRSRYYRICVSRTNKWQKWTDDETQRLRRLVELYYLDKWAPAEQGSARTKGLENNNELLDMLEGEESMTLGNRLIRLVEAADHCDAKASPAKKRRYAKIP